MKYLIVGLGNPGAQYQNTRHNIGFRVLDEFVHSVSSTFSIERYVNMSEVTYKGRKLFLLQPNTFMNLSGKAVVYWMQKIKVSQENVLVITDDISLPFGTLRLRKKGSHGGHNGLQDIQNSLGNSNYCRLRFGVGNNFARGKQAEYVLSDFKEEEEKLLSSRVDMAIKIIQSFSTIGVEHTMSNFNGK